MIRSENSFTKSESLAALPETTPPRTPVAGMFDLTRWESPPAEWPLAILPAVVAWLGGVAFLGQFRANQISDAIRGIAPLGSLFWGCVAASAVGVIGMSLLRKGRHAVLWAGVFGYLLGHSLFSWLPIHDWIQFSIPFTSMSDALSFVKHRLVYGACLAVCSGTAIVLAAWLLGAWPTFYLGIGSWKAIGRDFTYKSKPESYIKAMLGFAVFAAILWLVGQMSVELKPLRSGMLWGVDSCDHVGRVREFVH